MHLEEVHVPVAPVERFEPIIGQERVERVRSAYARLRDRLAGQTIWHVNSTGTGGGVAEMLQVLLAYVRGAGVDTRWMVIKGDPAFFATTKRLHNGLHAAAGAVPPEPVDRDHYAKVSAANAEELLALVAPGDIVVAHDPQTAGLIQPMRHAGAKVVWRCHIGTDRPDDTVARCWEFLRPFLAEAHAYVFSRRTYVPGWAPQERTHVIAPSIDPFSAKNQPMDRDTVLAVLAHVGVIAADVKAPPTFRREDGSPARIDHYADIIRTGPPPTPETPLVVQVSRWDRLKDMAGVMRAFALHFDAGSAAHLALVGPNVSGVSDDPEGGEVLDECHRLWRDLPHAERARIQLVCIPMYDLEENAAIVNALQRHAAVVVQKSMAEGFGLTVTEAMWKARPVIASAVGGISDQIVDGDNGLLLADATDLPGLGTGLQRLLSDPTLADRLGCAARQRVADRFLGDRHLRQWAEVFELLLDAG